MSLLLISLCLMICAKIYPFIIRKFSNKADFLRHTILYTAIAVLLASVAFVFIRKTFTIGEIITSSLITIIALMSIGGHYFSIKKPGNLKSSGFLFLARK